MTAVAALAQPAARDRRTPIFLFGAGGHGRSVFEVIERQGLYEVVTVLDDASPPGTPFRGLSITGGRERFQEVFEEGPREGFVAVGDNSDRERLTTDALRAGLSFVTLVDPSAQIARGVRVGRGTVVMPCVVVNVGAVVEEHAILNTSCSVDHDTVVRAFAHLSPGVHVSGECELGASCHIGIGATVVQCVRIGERARIGAGAAVIHDVPDDAVAVGVPARPLETNVAAGRVG
jgi:acetyltransferase EpsM